METHELKILGARIDNLSAFEIDERIKDALNGCPEGKFVVTLNPEIVLKAHRDEKYRQIINSADLNLCDGFGLKFSAWLRRTKLKSRYTGAHLVDCAFKLAKEKNKKVLVVVFEKSLSSPEEIERGIKEKYGVGVRAKYPNSENFFDSEEVMSAEIVLVNFGAPEQEKFIFDNRHRFPQAKIMAGVGGAFDFLTGKMKRAPKWVREMGLEWLWRLILEPKRARRIINAVFVFPFMAIINPGKK